LKYAFYLLFVSFLFLSGVLFPIVVSEYILTL